MSHLPVEDGVNDSAAVGGTAQAGATGILARAAAAGEGFATCFSGIFNGGCMQAWQVYLEELRRRVPDGTGEVFGREQMISEAAHDAYQRAADRMTHEHGWEDERTLVVMRGLNAAVKEWIGRGDSSWDTLGDDMQRREAEATNRITS